MDIFEEDAKRLAAELAETARDAPYDNADGRKSSAVIALCTRLENVLRVVDGQDIAAPFDGRMNHREMAAALTKLDEVRLWMLEHLRVRSMLAREAKYAEQVQEAQQAAERHANSAAGMSPERAAFLISAAEREALHNQQIEVPTASGWTPEEIEAAKANIEFVDPRESGKEPPAGHKWHLRRQYNITTDRHDLYRNLIEIA